jgi:hypothetical protein
MLNRLYNVSFFLNPAAYVCMYVLASTHDAGCSDAEESLICF